MTDLNVFLTFAAIAECGSFSRAAERLGISKALVSRHVADLERSLGVKLIHRTTRKLGLTAAGAVLHERCQQLLAHVQDARFEVERFRSAPGGVIKVTCAIAFGRLHLVPAIARFMAQNPAISIELDLSESPADLIAGDADIVIRRADVARLNSLVARDIARMRWVTCATPAYLAAHPAPQHPDALLAHNCITFLSSTKGEWSFDGPTGHHAIKAKGNFRANNADGVLQAVLGDMGIGILPTYVASQHLADGRLARVLPHYALPVRVLYAAYLPNPSMAQCVPLFVRFLREHFGAEPPWDKGLFAPGE